VEDFFLTKIRAKLSQAGQQTFNWGSWLVRMRWFEYLGMGFLLLRCV
jgi:arginine exporter protein ArgO